MKLVNEELLKKFDSFVKSISANDKVGIYHDSDPDGTCSAVIVAKAIKQLTGKDIAAHIGRVKGEHYLSVAVAEKMREMKLTKIITVDIASDEKPEGAILASEFAQVVVIDHHKLYNDLNALKSKNCMLIKPQLLYEDVDPQLYCTSKFVFDLFGRHTNLDELDWVSCVGIIADVASKAWLPFLNDVFKKFKIPITEDFFKSRLGKVAHIISSAEVYDEKNIPLCFNILYSAKHPRDILNSELKQFEKVISGEINYFVKNVKKFAEFYDDIGLIFYLFAPQHAITSPISTILGFKYPDKTVIIASKSEDRMHVSARRQDKKLAVNNLLENAVKGFENANAGGHIVAAGATFKAAYFETFKKRIIAQLTEISSGK